MNIIKYIICFATLLALAGCVNNVPKAEFFPPATQKKALTAQHWSWIAADAATRTRLALGKQGIGTEQAIYVADNAKYDFDKAFRKYLISHLIDSGVTVSTIPQGAIEVKYESQLIRHGNAIDMQTSGYKPGMLVAGVASFWVLRDVFSSGSNLSRAVGTTAVAGGYDAYQHMSADETPVELILATSITHQNKYLMLNADAYYIEKGEELLFQGCDGKRRCRGVK